MTDSEYELEGKIYVWTGTRWYAKRDFITPPGAVISRLNRLIAGELETEDSHITDADELVEKAQEARAHGQLPRAVRLLERAAAIRPEHLGTATVMCATLRQDGRPSEAIAATDRFASCTYQPLLTSRAAAYCDLGQWDAALRQINRVIALSGGRAHQEALNVRKRIVQNAPDLFES